MFKMDKELIKAFGFMVPNIPDALEMIPLGRERQLEIEVCRELRVPYFLIKADIFNNNSNLKIVTESMESFDEETFPVENPIESLKGYIILSRLWPIYVSDGLEHITVAGGENELTLNDFQNSENWPNYVEQRFINRKLKIVTASQLEQVVGQYQVNDKIFIKTKTKLLNEKPVVISVDDLAGIFTKGLPYFNVDQGGKSYKPIEAGTDIIISEPVPVSKNENGGVVEYRVWVVNNSVVTVGKYGALQSPEEVWSFALDFVEAHRGKLPVHYVFDIMLTLDRGYILTEVNDFMCAGTMAKSKDLPRKIVEAYTQ